MRLRPFLVLAVMVLLTSSCNGGSSADNTEQTVASVTGASSTSPAVAPEPATAADVVGAAVDSLVDVGAYSFEAKILLQLQTEPVEVELEGWVDGSDRELVLRAGGQSVITRVINGVATVEREGDTVEVPIAEAGSPPSILILKSIQNPVFETDTRITGQISASDLTSAAYEVTGEATIAVSVISNGTLAGYSMLAGDGSWSVDVKFTDIGEAPR